MEDSVWSIINAQGDTLRRDSFSNGVWKKMELIFYKDRTLCEKWITENFYDYPNRIETREEHNVQRFGVIYIYKINKVYYKNGERIKDVFSFKDSTRIVEDYGNYTKDSSYSKSIINGILNSEEIKYTNGSAHYKYYTPIDQISRYDVVAPKNNLTTTEEFFNPEYLRIEYNQDRNKKYLFHRTYYNKQGVILNQDTVNITDRGLINTTYYLDTIVKKESLSVTGFFILQDITDTLIKT